VFPQFSQSTSSGWLGKLWWVCCIGFHLPLTITPMHLNLAIVATDHDRYHCWPSPRQCWVREMHGNGGFSGTETYVLVITWVGVCAKKHRKKKWLRAWTDRLDSSIKKTDVAPCNGLIVATVSMNGHTNHTLTLLLALRGSVPTAIKLRVIPRIWNNPVR